MKQQTIFIFLMFLFIPLWVNAAECKGIKTSLEISRVNVPSRLRHDESIGQTRIILRSEADGKELFKKEPEGDWFCIGFNKETKTYVMGGIYQRGAWLPLGSIQYLREEGDGFEPSAFERSNYVAMMVITSPGGRYIVFIGSKSSTFKLYVLDIRQDKVKELGPAPAPPPDPSGFCSSAGDPFEWGTCYGDRYIEMDADIIRFKSEGVLEVSYGRDTPQARAKKRQVRLFKLL